MSKYVGKHTAEGSITQADKAENRARALRVLEKVKERDKGKIEVKVKEGLWILVSPDKDPAEAVAKLKKLLNIE